MRRFVAAAVAAVILALTPGLSPLVAPAWGQTRLPVPGQGPTPTPTPTPTPPPSNARQGSTGTQTVNGGRTITPLGLYVVTGIACSAVSPMIGTIMLGREMTLHEVWRSTFGCFLGPVGWLLADAILPPEVVTPPQQTTPHPRPPRRRFTARRRVDVPPRGATNFVPDEVLLEIADGASARTLARMARRLHLTHLETQAFTLTGRTLQRWRIGQHRTVRGTLQSLARYGIVIAAQPNWLYRMAQALAAATSGGSAQYVVQKLHLIAAHRITNGDNVVVAVIDSEIDIRHPDLAGVVAGEYDAVGGTAPPHPHGTAMAGAIAAHGKLIGVAPKVRLLAVRAFSGKGDTAQGTTFAILKGLDWAASKHARVINMSFAGPADSMTRDMLAKAYGRGIVLIAAVGNAGPRSPPLYPAAYRDVIGVTATGADDKLLKQANRGNQVAVSAPGVDILAPAPDDAYQLTSGTSVAAAHASGVAALLLARNPKLTPAQVRRILERSARHIAGPKRDIGAGEIDALAAVEAAAK